MPPPRPTLLLVLVPLALLVLALLLPRPAGAVAVRERWRWPVHGEIVAGFRYAPRHPFAAAQRRGIDIAAAPGAAVRSACRGRVTFAGPVPGGGGLGVSVRCGRLVATHLGLGRLAARRGARVGAGSRLGVVGPAGRLRLGARRRSARFGYVDPLALLADPPSAGPGPSAVPLGRVPRLPAAAPVRPPVARPVVPVRPALARPAAGPAPPPVAPRRSGGGLAATRPAPAVPGAAGRPAPSVPPAAWAGLVLLAAGVPLGGLVHRGRRRRRAARALATTVAGR